MDSGRCMGERCRSWRRAARWSWPARSNRDGSPRSSTWSRRPWRSWRSFWARACQRCRSSRRRCARRIGGPRSPGCPLIAAWCAAETCLNGRRADAPLLRARWREHASAIREVSARGAAARGPSPSPAWSRPPRGRGRRCCVSCNGRAPCRRRALHRRGRGQATCSRGKRAPRALVTAITMDLEAQKITTVSAVAQTSRRAVEMLLREAATLHAEGQFGEMLRAAERAREGAKYLRDLELEVHATRLEGDALKLLGRSADALVRYSWILGIADDPAHRAVVETGGGRGLRRGLGVRHTGSRALSRCPPRSRSTSSSTCWMQGSGSCGPSAGRPGARSFF